MLSGYPNVPDFSKRYPEILRRFPKIADYYLAYVVRHVDCL